MFILQTMRKYFIILGIIPMAKHKLPIKLQTFQWQLNCLHIILVMILLISFDVSIVWFLLMEKETFAQHYEAILFSSGVSYLNIVYWILIWQRSKLHSFIEELEQLITKRMYNLL